ncbi:MAG: PaaI family thioesterase [Actinomycetes bacterium]|jgi:hypothetical protein|nr:PaaI family thioesterase [Actinomycetes bacterium]
MEYRIVRAHDISQMCLVCGQHNHAGLHAQFLETDDEDGTLLARFRTRDLHQSYPGRVHGGIEAALLDELIGRTVNITEPTVWGVTMELRCKYRKPLPYPETENNDRNSNDNAGYTWARGRLTDNRSRVMEGTGEILLPDGTVAVEAWARYRKLPLSRIIESLESSDEHHVTNQHIVGAVIADTRKYPKTVTIPD